MAKVYQVKGLKSLPVAEFTSLGNFKLSALRDVDFLDYWNKHATLLTPYSIDYKQRCVVFVETSASAIELRSKPFLYQAQRDFAERVFLVPFDEVLALESNAFSRAENLVFLHSTGRCGSTLLCKLLEDTGEVSALSEPDYYTQWVMLDQQYGSRLDRRIPAVIEKLTNLLLAELEDGSKRDVLVIKLRGVCIHIADQLQQAHPYAKNIFLYRNAYDTSNSFLGLFYKLRLVRTVKRFSLDKLPVYWLGKLPLVKNKLMLFAPLMFDAHYNRTDAAGGGAVLALSWLSKMNRALRLTEDCPHLFACAVRYEDLMEEPSRLIQALAPLVGAHTPDRFASLRMQKTLESNSQKGSDVESDGLYRLSENDIGMIDRVLSRHDVINHSHYILPNTLMAFGNIASDEALAAGA
jgi:hypothetical protein